MRKTGTMGRGVLYPWKRSAQHTVFQRIMRAADEGRCVRLSWEETCAVAEYCENTAISEMNDEDRKP